MKKVVTAEVKLDDRVQFLAGVLLLLLFFVILSVIPLPGKVLKNNLENDIDASPLFYSEVENYQELEHSLSAKLHATEQYPR